MNQYTTEFERLPCEVGELCKTQAHFCKVVKMCKFQLCYVMLHLKPRVNPNTRRIGFWFLYQQPKNNGLAQGRWAGFGLLIQGGCTFKRICKNFFVQNLNFDIFHKFVTKCNIYIYRNIFEMLHPCACVFAQKFFKNVKRYPPYISSPKITVQRREDGQVLGC